MFPSEHFTYVLHLVNGLIARGMAYDSYEDAMEAAIANAKRRNNIAPKCVKYFTIEKFYYAE